MKLSIKIIIATLLVSFSALAELPANVLIQHRLSMVFAPAERRGFYLFQVLKNGTVRRVDNKKKTEVLAKLSKQSVAKLASAIDLIKSDELIKPEGRGCMDAPSVAVEAQQANGENLLIYRRVRCKSHNPKDEVAASVVKVFTDLKNALNGLDDLE